MIAYTRISDNRSLVGATNDKAFPAVRLLGNVRNDAKSLFQQGCRQFSQQDCNAPRASSLCTIYKSACVEHTAQSIIRLHIVWRLAAAAGIDDNLSLTWCITFSVLQDLLHCSAQPVLVSLLTPPSPMLLQYIIRSHETMHGQRGSSDHPRTASFFPKKS